MSENRLIQLFEQQFKSTPTHFFHAPGRVNLIGDHTDYNDGFVLPAAINFGTSIAAAVRDDKQVRVYAHDCERQISQFSLDDIQFDADMMWSNYVRGTLKILLASYPQINGANLVVCGNVPQGAGLSSSASFEMAIVKAFAGLYQLDIDGVKAALVGQKAENTFVGCNCGIMDQLISAMGKQDHAMLLDCRDLSFEDAPLPSQMSLLIVNSNVKRGLVDSEYNLRRQQCEQVAEHFKQSALRDITFAQLQSARNELTEVQYRRARHVITENERTIGALNALKNSDIAALSELMKASHQSLRDDFEVTTKEMDGLVEIIEQVIGNQGGVRMTGGGFGGCVVALVASTMVSQVEQAISDNYYKRFGLQADIYICTAAQGAFR